MKKISLILMMSFLVFSCQKENKPTMQSSNTSLPTGQSGSSENFDDIENLGKKDESCATEDEIKESFKPKPKEKPKAFKLQGGDPGCTTDGEAH